jgi:hypothetical protein
VGSNFRRAYVVIFYDALGWQNHIKRAGKKRENIGLLSKGPSPTIDGDVSSTGALCNHLAIAGVAHEGGKRPWLYAHSKSVGSVRC